MSRYLPLAATACAVLLATAGCGEAAAPARSATTPVPSRQAVPILLYHHIGTPPRGTRLPALWVKPADFRAQVRALARAGYRGVTLRQVLAAWERGDRLPRRPVVFSFDDGYADQLRRALPALRRAGWPGVLNLTLSNLPKLGGSREVRRLVAAGWEIASHTLTHPDLTKLSDAGLRRELTESRARILRLFGDPADVLCYPFGRYDARVVQAVRDAGYRAATTVVQGLAKPAEPFELARVRVNRTDRAPALVRELAALMR